MDYHEFAITGQVQIQLAAANAVLEAFLEAGQGVFRCFAFSAAVAVNKGHVYSLWVLALFVA
jgi:hypothetical protein